ncbi:hypothetical protein B9Z19DRAFT_1068942 [Tuber borchii]|uniref:Uncharacterized protein n=1 Tax=Tuber borchii TaxID=42251 RepID=A0A2T6ZDC7_TUBBO|nr:hypothetical protein B9Z19DRAFT_1068942 [Tuber borchii]
MSLQRLQATRFKHYWEQEAILRKGSEEEKASLVKRCQELEATVLKLSEEKAALLGKCQDNARLLKKRKKPNYETSLEHPDRLDCTWLHYWNNRRPLSKKSIDDQIREARNPLSPVLQEKQARQKLETILHIRGFLSFIVEKAVRDKIIKVTPSRWGKTQNGLEQLGQTREFTTILQQEVKARGLNIDWVMECFHMIYYMVSEPTFWNPGPVTVSNNLFDAGDRAILVTLLKVQSNWKNPLKWKEAISCNEGKY